VKKRRPSVMLPRMAVAKLERYKANAVACHAGGRINERNRWLQFHDDLMLATLRGVA
jgi:hypothetical protein